MMSEHPNDALGFDMDTVVRTWQLFGDDFHPWLAIVPGVGEVLLRPRIHDPDVLAYEVWRDGDLVEEGSLRFERSPMDR